MLPEARRTLGAAHDGGARRLGLGGARRRRPVAVAIASRFARHAMHLMAARLVSNPIPVSLVTVSGYVPIDDNERRLVSSYVLRQSLRFWLRTSLKWCHNETGSHRDSHHKVLKKNGRSSPNQQTSRSPS